MACPRSRGQNQGGTPGGLDGPLDQGQFDLKARCDNGGVRSAPGGVGKFFPEKCNATPVPGEFLVDRPVGKLPATTSITTKSKS